MIPKWSVVYLRVFSPLPKTFFSSTVSHLLTWTKPRNFSGGPLCAIGLQNRAIKKAISYRGSSSPISLSVLPQAHRYCSAERWFEVAEIIKMQTFTLRFSEPSFESGSLLMKNKQFGPSRRLASQHLSLCCRSAGGFWSVSMKRMLCVNDVVIKSLILLALLHRNCLSCYDCIWNEIVTVLSLRMTPLAVDVFSLDIKSFLGNNQAPYCDGFKWKC
jgi:hypothetical protein